MPLVTAGKQEQFYYTFSVKVRLGLTLRVDLTDGEYYLILTERNISETYSSIEINAQSLVRFIKGHDPLRDQDYFYAQIRISKAVIKSVFLDASPDKEHPIVWVNKNGGVEGDDVKQQADLYGQFF